MNTGIFLIILLFFLFINLYFLFFSNGLIVIGTMSQKTLKRKKSLLKEGFKEEKNFFKFILKNIFLKKTVYFSKNPIFLRSLILNTEDCREYRGENIAWVRNLTRDELEEIFLLFSENFSLENHPYSNDSKIEIIKHMRHSPQVFFLKEKNRTKNKSES